ncbi:hypothetical protein SDC9_206396 [bioreactor metagenome]|uniref:Uncharacterized protein n=1 Tax=bioreactor metagenome TaxID=1076179 RepID=A0A645J4Q9_9ZZZZ
MGDAGPHDVTGCHPGEIFVQELQGSAAFLFQAGDGPQRGGLAGSVGSDQGDDFAFPDGQGNALEGLNRPVVNGQIS